MQGDSPALCASETTQVPTPSAPASEPHLAAGAATAARAVSFPLAARSVAPAAVTLTLVIHINWQPVSCSFTPKALTCPTANLPRRGAERPSLAPQAPGALRHRGAGGLSGNHRRTGFRPRYRVLCSHSASPPELGGPGGVTSTPNPTAPACEVRMAVPALLGAQATLPAGATCAKDAAATPEPSLALWALGISLGSPRPAPDSSPASPPPETAPCNLPSAGWDATSGSLNLLLVSARFVQLLFLLPAEQSFRKGQVLPSLCPCGLAHGPGHSTPCPTLGQHSRVSRVRRRPGCRPHVFSRTPLQAEVPQDQLPHPGAHQKYDVCLNFKMHYSNPSQASSPG